MEAGPTIQGWQMAQVVVADDDDGVRTLLRFNLELEGHRVVGEAADGSEAIQVTCECRPDVLVLDMMMPGKNGADVLRALNTCSAGRPCVVAYSASPTHLELAGRLGADRTVLKSGDMSDLLSVVAGC
ncbi:MAG TPA: response regulator [Mycobacteriales bacterium]|nr:response regulator [Mycobacteriales bacterium]